MPRIAKSKKKLAIDPFDKMTVEEQRTEYMKCKADPAYFIAKYCKVRHPLQGLIPFLLWDFQVDLLKDFRKNRNNLYVKSRQLGISTLTACYAVWLAFFFKQKSILILATKRDVASNLLDKVKLAYDMLPEFFHRQGPVASDNATEFKLQNGSEIKCVATTENAVRSEALSLMILDEIAFVEEAELIWRSAKPALEAGGSCIALSSPNGEGNWFHEQYEAGEKGVGIFTVRKLMWWLKPTRDKEWEKEERKAYIKDEDFEQEYCCSFLASGRTVFAPSVMETLKKRVGEPRGKYGLEQAYWIWEERQQNYNYFITVDVCKGDGEDYSTAIVWKASKSAEQVAEYKGKIPTAEFGKLLLKIAADYGQCLIVVENNSYGTAVLNVLSEAKYPKIFYSKRDWKDLEKYNQYKNYALDKEYTIGLFTSKMSRDIVMIKLEEAVINTDVLIRSQRLIDELKVFIWKNGKRQAVKGKNDDLVMATAFAGWVWLDVFDKQYAVSQEFFDISKFCGRSTKTFCTEKDIYQTPAGRMEQKHLVFDELVAIMKRADSKFANR
jgi:hypothetical protein